MRWILGLLLGLLSAGFATADPPTPSVSSVESPAEAAQLDLALLKGDWKLALTQFNGRKVISSEGTVWLLTITADRWVMTRGPDRNAAFKLDPTQTPKQIDRTFRHGERETEAETTWPGIYKLDGDTLTICHSGTTRPDDFTTTAGDNRRILVWKRVKPTPVKEAEKPKE